MASLEELRANAEQLVEVLRGVVVKATTPAEPAAVEAEEVEIVRQVIATVAFPDIPVEGNPIGLSNNPSVSGGGGVVVDPPPIVIPPVPAINEELDGLIDDPNDADVALPVVLSSVIARRLAALAIKLATGSATVQIVVGDVPVRFAGKQVSPVTVGTAIALFTCDVPVVVGATVSLQVVTASADATGLAFSIAFRPGS